MKRAILAISLIVALWGGWYYINDVGHESAKTVIEFCNTTYTGSDWTRCSGDAWESYDTSRNRALTALILGGIAAFISGLTVWNEPRIAQSKRES